MISWGPQHCKFGRCVKSYRKWRLPGTMFVIPMFFLHCGDVERMKHFTSHVLLDWTMPLGHKCHFDEPAWKSLVEFRNFVRRSGAYATCV